MKQVVKKDFIDIVCSPTGCLYAFVFALVPGLFLWIFPGNLNIPDSGYAELGGAFRILSILLLVMVPAITMRGYADEFRLKTWELLHSHPLSSTQIFTAKFLASWIFTLICILPSGLNVAAVWLLGFPQGNIDLGQVALSYLAIATLASVFVAIGLFASSLAKNPVASFILAIAINSAIFYGFDLLAGVFSQGAIQVAISQLGINYHLEEACRGILLLKSAALLAFYFALFALLTILITLNSTSKPAPKHLISVAAVIALILMTSLLPNVAADLTSDNRYTLSPYSQKVLQNIQEQGDRMTVRVYLNGDLNSRLVRLRNHLNKLLADANRKSGYALEVEHINPLPEGYSSERVRILAGRGMSAIVLNETDRNGKLSRQLIFPYLELIHNQDTVNVNILKNIPGFTAEENLNASAENMEYDLIDAIRVLTDKQSRDIAFIEGHNELPRPYLFDAEEALAAYFSVNRGEIPPTPGALDPFKVVVIAGPTQRFSEEEKYVIDQYIMQGGRVLWLLDGLLFSEEQLTTQGRSATVANPSALEDMLFAYGVRLNPVLLQDKQSASLLVSSGTTEHPASSVIPWYFCPLLIPSPNHPITKNIAPVRAPYVASLDLIPKDGVKPSVLLTTSGQSHLVKATEEVNFDVEHIAQDPNYFDRQYLITAASLEGQFRSVFQHRPTPPGIEGNHTPASPKSKNTKMLVMAASSVIRNELAGQNEQTQIVPLGFDRTAGKQFGNKDFIVNAVNWLADDQNALILRQKQHQLRLLDKDAIARHRSAFAVLSLSSPLILLGGFIFGVNLFRRRRYAR